MKFTRRRHGGLMATMRITHHIDLICMAQVLAYEAGRDWQQEVLARLSKKYVEEKVRYHLSQHGQSMIEDYDEDFYEIVLAKLEELYDQ